MLRGLKRYVQSLIKYIEDNRNELSKEQVNNVTDLVFRLWELQNEFDEKFRKIGG